MQSDWQGGSKVFRVHLVLILLVASFGAVPAGANAAEAAEPSEPLDTLYFLPVDAGVKNFTTFAPNGTQGVLDEPDEIASSRFIWMWLTPSSPRPWSLSPQHEMVATIHLEGLDHIVPVPDPRSADSVGKIRVQVDIFVGGGANSDGGATSTALDPSFANATGGVLLDPPMVTGGPAATVVEVPLRARDKSPVSSNLEFAVRVVVTGMSEADARPNIVVGDAEAPSGIRIPAFPLDEFRSWEETLLEEKKCLDAILQGGACPTETTAPTPQGTVGEETPGAPAFVVLLVLLGTLSNFRGSKGIPRPPSRQRYLCRGRIASTRGPQ